jgi:hypothetical protein
MIGRCPAGNSEEFHRMMECMIGTALGLAEYVDQSRESDDKTARCGRTALGRLYQEVTRLEEVLDAYGAKHNTGWLEIRRSVAAVKLFSNVQYKLLHLRYTIPLYSLQSPEEGPAAETSVDGLIQSTEDAVYAGHGLLRTACRWLLQAALDSSLHAEKQPYIRRCYEDEYVAWRLPSDLEPTNPCRNPGEIIVNLATMFLNKVESSDFRDVYHVFKDKGFRGCVPSMACEKDFRQFEQEFHNLQALYDSYVWGTNIENRNPRLRNLRGHATVAYHLIEVVTGLTHYYERHIERTGNENPFAAAMETIESLVVSYALRYATLYAVGAQSLCRELIRSYTEIVSEVIPAPVYRGFHVRPSTLIARIVRHYGSTVWLELEDEKCDAGSSLDIIRVNEKINAVKRRAIAKDVAELSNRAIQKNPGVQYESAAREILLELFQQNKLVLYSNVLVTRDVTPQPGESLGEYTRRLVAQLLVEGQIDIQANVEVTVRGDKRAVEDIRILAQSGYGEDRLGNNIPLPPELSYLKR